ncbi:hypothetical protein LHK_01314 [Laribacter hongkongensis HLHK9]|uniref:Uncharacterized protein n=1 Tax=Laribacter hongkongensis (strain HLHK9) TaxID=557598 RepID=C1D764_LARHH|nr:hypothetical protein LHK_01314 [Laribacter hongkongensis HLHK9]
MPALLVMKMPGDAGDPGALQELLPQACHLLRQLTLADPAWRMSLYGYRGRKPDDAIGARLS